VNAFDSIANINGIVTAGRRYRLYGQWHSGAWKFSPLAQVTDASPGAKSNSKHTVVVGAIDTKPFDFGAYCQQYCGAGGFRCAIYVSKAHTSGAYGESCHKKGGMAILGLALGGDSFLC